MATFPPFRSSSKNLKPAETFFTTLDRKDPRWMTIWRSGRQGVPATGDPRSIPAIDRTRGCAEHSCATEEHSFFLVTSGFEPEQGTIFSGVENNATQPKVLMYNFTVSIRQNMLT